MRKIICLLTISILVMFINYDASAQGEKPYVRIAKLTIDSLQLEQYKSALTEHAQTAVKVEPGVLTLYAVADKKDPTHILVFEIYADEEAYKLHLESAHFKKYKALTKDMVTSLDLMETIPLALASKAHW